MSEFHVDWHDFILQELAEPNSTREQVAQTYSYLISYGHKDWGGINRAIIKRWSESGLKWIKNRAWKQVKPRTVRL